MRYAYLLQTNRTCISQGENLSHRKIHFKQPLGTFYNIPQWHQHHPLRSTITSLVKSTKTRAMGEVWVTSAFRASWEPSKTRRSFSIVIEWLLFRCFGTFDPFHDFVVSEILHSLLLDSDSIFFHRQFWGFHFSCFHVFMLQNQIVKKVLFLMFSMFSMIMGVFVIFVKETTKYNTKSCVLLSHGRVSTVENW